MKKKYIIPQTKIQVAFTEVFQTASGVNGKIDNTVDINWGGIDESGSLDPSSNSFGKIWDDGDSWDQF